MRIRPHRVGSDGPSPRATRAPAQLSLLEGGRAGTLRASHVAFHVACQALEALRLLLGAAAAVHFATRDDGRVARAALVAMTRERGDDYLEANRMRNNVARLLRDLRHYDEAEVMLRRVLAIFENALGEDHPSTLISVNQERIHHYGPQGKGARSGIDKAHRGCSAFARLSIDP